MPSCITENSPPDHKFLMHTESFSYCLMTRPYGMNSRSSAQIWRERPVFKKVADLGREIDAGLLALLFGPALERWTREYGLL